MTQRELKDAIRELQQLPVSVANCEKLAAFYTVYDHLYGDVPQAVSVSQEVVSTGGSEFLNAINGMNADDAWQVIDESMNCICQICPDLYNEVMKKIR